MLCVVVISLTSVLFLFGKLFISSINFTLSRGYFLFCFVSSHSINTHELRGDFVGGGGAISFAFCVCQHTSQKLTLHKQTELLFFVQLVHSFLSVYFLRFGATFRLCVLFLLNDYPNWAIDFLVFPIFYEITTNLLLANFLFLENKIDLLAIIGCHLCITWRFHFFRFRYLPEDVPLVLSNFV